MGEYAGRQTGRQIDGQVSIRTGAGEQCCTGEHLGERTDGWVHAWAGGKAHRSTGRWVYKWLGGWVKPMDRCASSRVGRCTGVHSRMYTGAKVYSFTGVQVHK